MIGRPGHLDDSDDDTADFFEVYVTSKARMQSEIYVEGDSAQLTGVERVRGIRSVV